MAVSFNSQSGPPERQLWNTNLHTLVPDCWRALKLFLAPCDQYLLSLTAKSLRGRFSPVKKKEIHRDAAKNGHLVIVQWLHIHFKWPFTASLAVGAVEGNQFQMIEWLHQHPEMVAHTKSSCFDVTLCETAAGMGNLDMLKKLRLYDCPWNETTWYAAVEEGHLHVLTWLYDNHCPNYDRNSNGPTCTFAAHRGHLQVLQWARDRNFNWTALTYALATSGGHHEVVEWLRRHRCPGS